MVKGPNGQAKEAAEHPNIIEALMNLARPVAATKHAMDAVGAGRCPAAPIDNRCAGYQPAPQSRTVFIGDLWSWCSWGKLKRALPLFQVGGLPGLVRVEAGDLPRQGHRVRPQILAVDDAVLADDEGQDAGDT